MTPSVKEPTLKGTRRAYLSRGTYRNWVPSGPNKNFLLVFSDSRWILCFTWESISDPGVCAICHLTYLIAFPILTDSGRHWLRKLKQKEKYNEIKHRIKHCGTTCFHGNALCFFVFVVTFFDIDLKLFKTVVRNISVALKI